MKEFSKTKRHNWYKKALEHYLSLEKKCGLCYSLSNCYKNKLIEDYDHIPMLFSEFKKHEDKINGSWPYYSDTEYRIKLLKEWIKCTKPVRK